MSIPQKTSFKKTGTTERALGKKLPAAIEAEKALFLFVNKQIVCNTSTLSEVYSNNKDSDGFLYIEYMEENVFG